LAETMPRRWGFLTNHAVIMIHVVLHPRSTVREIALASGMTERAALSILRGLREEGIIDRRREGRQNVYSLNFDVTAGYRREGRSPELVPDMFVAELLKEILRLGGNSQPPASPIAAAAEPSY
jgi:DNA-binding transcriptional ArsR family regulator